jgi:glycosyltransferase involved in cell wall biosynthesis
VKVTVVVPVLNEILGIREYLPRLRRAPVDQILVLDGGSTDGTAEYALEQKCDLVVQTRPGMRMAYMEAYPQIRGDVVITFSPDGNSIAETIPKLIEKMHEGYDMVIASRYKDGAKSYDDTILTQLANRAFTSLVSRFGYSYTDAMVIYRAYRRELPRELGLTEQRSDWWERSVGRWTSWEPQMSIRCAKAGLKIAEIPSDEPRRLDETGSGRFLPATRIQHFRAGAACFTQLVEEVFVWRKRVSREQRSKPSS